MRSLEYRTLRIVPVSLNTLQEEGYEPSDDSKEVREIFSRLSSASIIDALTKRQKVAAILLGEKGMDKTQAAQEMKITVRSLYKLVYRMRRRLLIKADLWNGESSSI